MSDLTPRQTPIEPGMAAPDFTLKTQDKEEWTLSEALKKGDVALCFFPFAFSGVCSTEMKCVNDQFADLEAKGVTPVGVDCDSFFSNKAWAESMGLKQTLLADLHRQVCKAYGMYWPDLNVATRGTVLVGKDGKVKWVQKRDIPNAMDLNDLLAAAS